MLSSEDVVMLIEKGKKIKVIAGNFKLKDGPYDVFDENIVKLLNKIYT